MANKEKKLEQAKVQKKFAVRDVLSAINPLLEARAGLNTTLKLLISALTLVSALAWNEAIKGIFEYLKQFLPTSSTVLLGQFLYALFVTLITVFLINRLKAF